MWKWRCHEGMLLCGIFVFRSTKTIMFNVRASSTASRLSRAVSSSSSRRFARRSFMTPSYPPTKLHDSLQQGVARAKFLAVNALWNPNFNFDDVLSGGSQAYARVPSLISSGDFHQLESMVHPKILRFLRERKIYPGAVSICVQVLFLFLGEKSFSILLRHLVFIHEIVTSRVPIGRSRVATSSSST